MIDFNKCSEKEKQYLLEEVKRDCIALKHIKNPSVEVWLEAVKHWNFYGGYLKESSKEMQLVAVKENGYAIQLSAEIQVVAMQGDGNVVPFLENPSIEVWLEAVKQNGYYAIQFLNNPSVEMQLVAVKHWPFKIVENPSIEVQLAALEHPRAPIKIVKEPSIKVQLAALGLPFPNAIKSVSFIEEDLTPEQKDALYKEALRLDAVKKNSDAIKDFNNPSEEVIKVSKMSAIEKMKYFCKEQ